MEWYQTQKTNAKSSVAIKPLDKSVNTMGEMNKTGNKLCEVSRINDNRIWNGNKKRNIEFF